VFDVHATKASIGKRVTGRGIASGTPDPLPPCLAPVASHCEGPVVHVRRGDVRALPPGTYGEIRLDNEAALRLAAGAYVTCGLRTGRRATVTALGAVTLDVLGRAPGDSGHGELGASRRIVTTAL
jgi:hypothetical protein